MFRPNTDAPSFPKASEDLALAILSRCRGEAFSKSSLRDRLTLSLQKALEKSLGTTDVGSWMGFIWHRDKRKLLPAFGDFAAQSWAARFAAGNGVAGHAFRHGASVAWTKKPAETGVSRRISTVYQELTEHRDTFSMDYLWVLNIPLRIMPTGPSIGVIGLARERSQTDADRSLQGLAEALVSGSSGGESQDLLAALETRLNGAFWLTLAISKELSAPQQAYARERMKALGFGA